MAKKIVMNEDIFNISPFDAINDMINRLYEEKKPFLIEVEFIKKESESYIVKYNNELHRIGHNYVMTSDKDYFFVVDSRNLYDYKL